MKRTLAAIIILFIWLPAFSQCYSNRHSTTWYDGWISCMASQSPNPARGVSHWIMYNFGEPYCITTSTLWNVNDPSSLNNGIQGYAVDYSTNGTIWTSLGTFTAEKGSGSPIYEGIPGPDFDSIITQYLLFTALSNYGGNCHGFSEIKINLAKEPNRILKNPSGTLIAYPNPFIDQIGIRYFGGNSIEDLFLQVTDVTGRTVFSGQNYTLSANYDLILNNSLSHLSPGVYLLKAQFNNETHSIKLIKK